MGKSRKEKRVWEEKKRRGNRLRGRRGRIGREVVGMRTSSGKGGEN